jgi:cytochrome b6-f complex iron-sulfur subunit
MKLLSTVVALFAASSASAFAPLRMPTKTSSAVAPRMATSSAEDFYIDDERRFVMNVIMFGSTAVTVGALGIPFILFFFPPGVGGGDGGIPAKDALGNDIIAKDYLASKPAGDRSLAQGLKGDAT